MIVKLLTEHHLEFLSLKEGCRGSSESTLVKMSNCWKSHAAAHLMLFIRIRFVVFGNDVFSKHLFPMVSYTQNKHKIPIPSNPRSTLLPSPLPRPLQPV